MKKHLILLLLTTISFAQQKTFTNPILPSGADPYSTYYKGYYYYTNTLGNKLVLWKTISSLIQQLNDLQLINVQSTCHNCGYFLQQNGNNYCKLLDIKLEPSDIRLDCHDHKPVRL